MNGKIKTAEQYRKEFLDEVKNIKREGIADLIAYLDNKTDFFKAPASTRFHASHEGGLARHSINTYIRLVENLSNEQMLKGKKGELENIKAEDILETASILGLFHDICKINHYEFSKRNVKNNETGQWETKPYIKVRDDILGYGHGEESVYILSSFIKLTREEAFAIRFHMGDFTDPNTSKAYAKYPLALQLHLADMQATYLDDLTK